MASRAFGKKMKQGVRLEQRSERSEDPHQTSCQSVEPLQRLAVADHAVHPVNKQHDLTER